MAVGLLVVYGFLRWEGRLEAAAKDNPQRAAAAGAAQHAANRQLTGGLGMFFSQFMIQAGAFFAVPLFLSVVLGLNAMQTGVRLVPLSIALLVTAIGIPKVWPKANPRRVVRLGLLLLIVGIGFLVAGMDPDADASVMTIPMVLMGLGLGALGLAAGRGHRLRGVREGDRRGRRAAEHRDEPRRLDGHRADRFGADRHAEHRGADRRRRQPAGQRRGEGADLHRTGRRCAVRLRRPARRRADRGRGQPAARSTRSPRSTRTARLEALQVAFALVGFVAIGALFITSRMPTVPAGLRGRRRSRARRRTRRRPAD